MAERMKDPAVAGLFEFNKDKCTDPRLQVCFQEQTDTLYGTLSHSHLLLVLLSFRHGASWKVPAEFRGLLNQDGGWNFAAVAEIDPALGQLCRNGLFMEVLSWKMYVEEPDACSLISQALNKKHAHALHTTEITALAALLGACASELESAVAGKIVFESVQRRVRIQLAEYADEPEFIDLFEFVVNIGVRNAPFLPHLMEFLSTFVDSKKRQLRLQAFAMVNKLPNACPWTKIALVMRCYRQQPARTWCPTPEPFWFHADPTKFEKVEQMMHYFHNTLSPAVASMSSHSRLTLLTNVAINIVDAFARHKDTSQLLDKLCQAAVPFHDQVVAHCVALTPHIDVPSPRSDWIRFTSEKPLKGDDAAVAASSGDHLRILPTVIAFDPKTGQPINDQEARESKGKEPKELVRFEAPWKEWMAGAVAHTLDRELSDIAAINVVLRSLNCKGDAGAAPVSVSCGLCDNSRQVTVTQDIQPGELQLFPCAPKSARISKTSCHPDRVTIRVQQTVTPGDNAADATKTYYMHPEYKLPADVTDKSTEAVAPGIRLWHWSGEESMFPFWAVERVTEEWMFKTNSEFTFRKEATHFEFNVEHKELEFACVSVGAVAGTSIASTVIVRMPVLTNTCGLDKGTRLFMPAAAAKLVVVKRKDESWRTHVGIAKSQKKRHDNIAMPNAKSKAAHNMHSPAAMRTVV